MAAVWQEDMHIYSKAVIVLICSYAAAQTPSVSPQATVKTPQGARLPLMIIRPLSRKTAAVHDAVYAQTLAPVVHNGQVLIPAGTQLQGEIETLTQPGFFRPHAIVTIHFPQMVVGGSYVISLDDELSGSPEKVQLTVGVTLSNQFLLDTGTTFDLPLRTSVPIDITRLPAASSGPGAVASSSTCKPTAGFPGTPGTPDTVIPGTPGTPDNVIPGVNGAPPPHRDSRHACYATYRDSRNPRHAWDTRHALPGSATCHGCRVGSLTRSGTGKDGAGSCTLVRTARPLVALAEPP